MKTNGWTEEEAQRELELINNENQITNVVGWLNVNTKKLWEIWKWWIGRHIWRA
jgi:hypothetical protein